jgi:hypothetical protein
MPTYTVHQPPLRTGEAALSPERFVFVRDGFYVWAFLLPPLWLLLHRLWLALIGFAVFSALLGASLALAGAPGAVKFFAGFVIALVTGFEAATLWRWTLSRNGWTVPGFVVADDSEMAERRFFSQWAESSESAAPPAPVYATPVRRGPPSADHVIGLFPEPGPQR